MVWFYCDDCGDSIKKPKLVNHYRQCPSRSFTCIDCSRIFTRATVQSHTTCVTEHEKYALGATKPGGFAEKGFHQDGAAGAGGPANNTDGEPVGLQFLSSRPPWTCSVCNVNCTSRETLLGHASGIKHKRRARAAQAAADGGNTNSAATPAAVPAEQQQAAPSAAAEEATASAAVAAADPACAGSTKAKSSKKDKTRRAAAAEEQEAAAAAHAGADQQPELGKKAGKKGSKKGSKKSKAASDKEPAAQQVPNELIKAVHKRLKKAGSLSAKKLRKLAQKKLGDSSSVGDAVLQAMRQQLVQSGRATAEDTSSGFKLIAVDGQA